MRTWPRNTASASFRFCWPESPAMRRSTRPTAFIRMFAAPKLSRISSGRNWNRCCRVPLDEARASHPKPFTAETPSILMIQLRGVSKTVQSGGHPLTILHPLDLDVADGQCLAIIGPSGSGKSTLLGLIAGLDAPSTGTISIAGQEITTLDEDSLARLRGERIGFVFQFFHLVPSLTAMENIQVPMEIAGRSDARARAQALLDEVGLHDRGHHYPSQLSGGEQQRIAIARALANDPPLILADEPTGNLDSSNGRHILDLLLQVRRSRGVTLVLVTHDPSVAAVADERLVLRDGKPAPGA